MQNISMSDAELLKYAIENGMLDTALVQEKIEMQRRKELLEKHPYSIYMGKDKKWYTYMPSEECGRIRKKRNFQKEIEDIVIDYWREQEENPTLEEVFSEYNDRRLELKKISAATHIREKQDFNRFYKDWKNRRIRGIKEEEVADLLEESVSKYDLTSKAYSNLKGLTRRMFKRARKRKFVSFLIEDVFNEIDMSEVEFKKTIKEDYEEVFTEEEYPIMMNYLEQHIDIWNLGILLLIVTGVRVGELVGLSFSDFTEYSTFISFKIRRTETRYQDKNGKWVYELKEAPKTDAGIREAIIPMQYTWVLQELKRINPNGEFVFMRNGDRMTTNTIRRRIKRICEKNDIYPKSPHKARKTYGSILLDNKLDERLIIGQMGHTNISCTERHYHRNRRSVEAKAMVINSIPEFMAK